MSSQVLLVNWALRYQNFGRYCYHRIMVQMNTQGTYLLYSNSYFKKAVQTERVASITLPEVPVWESDPSRLLFFFHHREYVCSGPILTRVNIQSVPGSGVCLWFMQLNATQQNHLTTVSYFQPYSQNLLLFKFSSCLLLRRETLDI